MVRNIKLYGYNKFKHKTLLITANLGEKQITEKHTKTRCFLLDKNLNIYLISKNLPPSATKPQFWVPYQLQQPANAQAMF